MTLIDYAKYLLNVCGKRFTHLYRRHYLESTNALPSLSAILSYLRTQTASIFTQIKARGAVHPLSGLPTNETLATLPTALATLSTRKVDTYTSTNNVEDGESLGRMLVTPYLHNELIDRTSGWGITDRRQILYSNVERCELGCTTITAHKYNDYTICMPKLKSLLLPNLVNVESIGNATMIGGMPLLEEIIAPSFVGYGPTLLGGWATVIGSCAELRKVVFGKLIYSTRQSNSDVSLYFPSCPKLIHFEIGEGTAINLQFDQWNPTNVLSDATNLATFRTNFQTYILNRLSTSVTGRTLTVSSSVFAAVSDLEVPAGWTLVSA